MKQKTLEDFISKARDIHGDTFDYSKSVYGGRHAKLEIICKKHGSFFQCPSDHFSRKKGKGCPKCFNEIRGDASRMSYHEFVERSSAIHNNKYEYLEPIVWKDLKNLKISIRCPKHGAFEQRVSDHLYLACGCPICCESLGERFVSKYLEDLGFSFEKEKVFKWLVNPKTGKSLPLDFYIDELKLAIEVDGGQHRYPVEHFGGKKYFEEMKIKDLLRTNLCSINGISLIRVFYSDRRELSKTLDDIQSKMKGFFDGKRI